MEKDLYTPKSTQGKFRGSSGSEQLALTGLVVAQIISLIISFYYYSIWYEISKYGASAVVSSVLCGFSQGLLQLIVHGKMHTANLLKFYCWGVINGFWMVSIYIYLTGRGTGKKFTFVIGNLTRV